MTKRKTQQWVTLREQLNRAEAQLDANATDMAAVQNDYRRRIEALEQELDALRLRDKSSTEFMAKTRETLTLAAEQVSKATRREAELEGEVKCMRSAMRSLGLAVSELTR